VYHFSPLYKLPHTRVDGVLRGEGILLHPPILTRATGCEEKAIRARARADFVEWNRG
jgi:hypothetical protein